MAAESRQAARSRVPGIRARDLVAVCALALPLVLVLPGGLFPYELPKLVGCAVALVLAAIAARRGALPQSVLLIVAGGAVLLLLAALLSSDPLVAVVGRWPRYEGVIALPLFGGMLWAGARLLGPDSPRRQVDAFVSAVAVAVLLILIVAVVEATGLRPIAGDAADRTGALLGTATDEGLVGAASAVLLLGAVIDGGTRRVLHGCGLAASGALVVLAASRGGYLALGIGVVLLAVRLLLDRRRRQAAVVGGAAVLVVAVGLVVPTTADRLLGATSLARATVANRGLIWQETLQMLLHAGPLGVGPSGFVQRILPFQTEAWGRAVGFDAPIDSPHTVVLQAASAGGPLLVLAGLALAALLLLRGLRAEPERATFACAALGMVAGLLTTFPTAGTASLLLVLIGAAVARPAVRRDPRGVRVVWIAVGAVLLVVTAAGAAAEVPLRAARDAAQAGRLQQFESQTAAARALRPWDPAVDSIAAQTAVQAAQVRQDPGFLTPAITDARRALAVVPDDHDSLTALAVALQTRGDDRAALPLWNRLVAQSPADAGLLVHRLVSRAQTGDVTGAIRDAELAIRLDPSNADARKDLAILRQQTGG